MRRPLLAILLLAGCRQLAGLDDLELDAGADGGGGSTLVPSNEVTAHHTTDSGPPITINDVVTFDVDTGEISGAFLRAPVVGIVAGIEYSQATFGAASHGVFEMRSLAVSPAGVIRLRGARSAVFLVNSTVRIEGKIDGSGGCADPNARSCAGPGGGEGSMAPAVATGCAPGNPGATDLTTGGDGGGGGGGGGQSGGNGGTEIVMTKSIAGGTGGPRCVVAELEPLLGGGGGGGGGRGTAPQGASGGGGGGALQITAFGAITIIGSIVMSGAGGEGGTRDPATANGGAGGGGGAGGSVLLEAPQLTISGTLAANGGGGGGSSNALIGGQPGANGGIGTVPAAGGAGAGAAGAGGNGGAIGVEPESGVSTSNVNAGAGGGGAGRIFLRSSALPALAGAAISPAPGVGQIRTR